MQRSLLASALLVTSISTWLGPLQPDVAVAADPCVLSPILVNPCRPMLGAHAGTYPNVPNGTRGQIDAHEARIGRQVDVVHLYHGPGARPLDSLDRYYATRPDTILLLNWKPVSRWRDGGGANATVNAQIDAAADSVKTLGATKIMLAIHHEAENDVTSGATGCTSYNGSAGTPAEYRAMWRNVRTRFDARGATNVVWVMNYMGWSGWDCLIDDLWPGNDLVDWVTWDPYSESDPWNRSMSFFYDFLTRTSDAEHDYLSKPWGLSEWSTWRRPTRAFTYQYYDDARASIARGDFPRLKLYTVFDYGSDSLPASRIAYDANGVFDQVELDHYRALVNDPIFVGTWTPPGATPVDQQPPTAPTALTVTGTSVTEVRLEWQASTDDVGVHHYRVLRDDVVVSDAVTAAGFTDTGVEPATSYRYTVRAVDAAGNVGEGVEVVAETPAPTPDTQPPSAPGALSASQVAADRVVLQWPAATDDVGVDHYEVLRDGVVVAAGAPAATYTDLTVAAASTYVYVARAVDAAGNVGENSGELSVTTPAAGDTTPPSAPTALRATFIGVTQARLAWNAASDNVGVTSYQVFRGTTRVATVTSLTHLDSTLRPNTSYGYRVRAVDAAGNLGPMSATLTIRTPRDTTAPTTPRDLTATAGPVGTRRIALRWTGSTDNVRVTGYRVYRGSTLVATVTTGTTYTATGLQANTVYTFTVRAVDAAGNASAASNSASARAR